MIRLLLLAALSLAARTPNYMWSIQPQTMVSISDEGNWTDVAGTTLTFPLNNDGVVMISYSMIVSGDKPYTPGGDFLNDNRRVSGVMDVVGARLLVNGVANRKSGSHYSPAGSLESSSGILDGHLYMELGAGNHTVQLQWRKWGRQIRAWANRPNIRDGYAEGRQIAVSANHKAVWYTQPQTPALLSEMGKWTPMESTAVTFTLPERATLRFVYLFYCRPDKIHASDVLNKRDDIGARLLVDGAAYRESGSTYSTTSKVFTTGTLSGNLVMEMQPGKHTVQLQWRKWGAYNRTWRSDPTYLDGFVSGRSLAGLAAYG